jgi:hypothetical protein
VSGNNVWVTAERIPPWPIQLLLSTLMVHICLLQIIVGWPSNAFLILPLWAEKNHGVIHSVHQQQFSINILAGTVGDCLVGLHVLLHQLMGNHCQNFLLHDLSKLLEDVPLALIAQMWYMHDRAVAHFSHAVRDVLNHDWCIGRGGPAAWPPQSPVLNPLESYLNRHHHCIVDDSQNICNYSPFFNGYSGPWWDVSRHVLNLMEDILSTYYKCNLSAITHKLNISRHIGM